MSLKLFAALPIPDSIATRLLPLQSGLEGAAWRPRENLHLTLKYFGETGDRVAEDLDTELASISIKRFDIALRGAGSFGGIDPHAVWIGVEAHPSLFNLAKACERAADRARLKTEKRRYVPHVTMAYLKGAQLDHVKAFERRCALFQTPAFTVDRFHLYSSLARQNEPNIYRIEAEYPLG